MKHRQKILLLLILLAMILPFFFNPHKNNSEATYEEIDSETNTQSRIDSLVKNSNQNEKFHFLKIEDFLILKKELMAKISVQAIYLKNKEEQRTPMEIIPEIGAVIGVFEELYFKQPELRKNILATFRECADNSENPKLISGLCIASFHHLSGNNLTLEVTDTKIVSAK